MREFALIPTNGQKSFYGKATVRVADNGEQTLYSYGTPIIRRCADGHLQRLWFDWSATTGKHIRSFCGLNKAQFTALK